ncbi:MAG: cbb3-type cytochrome c oxidase subunit 3 [Rhodospirillales bacterium]|nr:cbb3-type cytochrome c oxidase subunit 3 [Rhodospirillales bacterium]MBO6787942.1 cbb3-type cytochrome c oxidase subunit 3 [Rhodospirillales bacterium]
MAALLREHFVIVFLVLFAGILYWAFRPGKRNKNQIVDNLSSKGDSDREA